MLLLGVSVAATFYVMGADVAVLQPSGIVAEKQRDLIVIVTLIMMVIVIPVFGLTAYISWKYREGNQKAVYKPEWDHDRVAESIWWGFPLVIIVALSVIIWQSSHRLDPSKPLASNTAPMTIQVVALQWKWLFIYPQQNIATVNYVQFPEKTPIRFELTSDAPMNSFWIPRLGGQVYAMSGMTQTLQLMANEEGYYDGSSANLSGEGFADMKFTARSSSQQDFDEWVSSIKQQPDQLDRTSYQQLAIPSKDNSPAYYSAKDAFLYDTIIAKYLHPDDKSMHSIPNKNHQSMGH